MDRVDERSRLDEAVNRMLDCQPFAETENRATRLWELLDAATPIERDQAMRAALLAALPVLLGEPVACMHPDTLAMLASDIRAKSVKADRPTELNLLEGYVPLYAPSLGEGDGR